MNIVDLDGHNVQWHLKGYIAKGKLQNKSALHLSARELINQMFPTLQILEEVNVPLRKNETLYLDFYLPLNKLAIEVHGQQHYEFVPFYHSNRMNFFKAQKRDQEKKEWCHINDIKYIEFPYNENIEQWKERLINV
jgi:hypothetical protein